ncbi:MAG: hypothetical protein ABIS36_25415 [Chryseolinea sp.]
MKIKINILFCALVIGTQMIANAQTTASSVPVKGSPYLQEKYVDGVIYYADKNITAPLRYNAFQDLLEYQENGKALVLDATMVIQKAQLGNLVFVPHKYDLGGKSKLGYFELLDSGKVMLLSKRTIAFAPEKKGKALDGGDMPAEYKRKPDTYYYKVGSGGLQEVTSIQSFISSFPDKQEELTKYAKKQKISPRKEKELVQLIDYYNSL